MPRPSKPHKKKPHHLELPSHPDILPGTAHTYKKLTFAFFASTVMTFAFASFLSYNNVPASVILPTSAPIWIGLTTLLFLSAVTHEDKVYKD